MIAQKRPTQRLTRVEPVPEAIGSHWSSEFRRDRDPHDRSSFELVEAGGSSSTGLGMAAAGGLRVARLDLRDARGGGIGSESLNPERE